MTCQLGGGILPKLAFTLADLYDTRSQIYYGRDNRATHRMYSTPSVCALISNTARGSCPFDKKLINKASLASFEIPFFKVWLSWEILVAFETWFTTLSAYTGAFEEDMAALLGSGVSIARNRIRSGCRHWATRDLHQPVARHWSPNRWTRSKVTHQAVCCNSICLDLSCTIGTKLESENVVSTLRALEQWL